MFSRAKDEKNKRRTTATRQVGIFGVLEDTDDFIPKDDGTDDEDLEAELLALTAGGTAKQKKDVRVKNRPEDLDAMVAASLQDMPSDDEGSVNENDPELLDELGDLMEDTGHGLQNDVVEKEPVRSQAAGSNMESLLKDRLQMYEKAEHNANSAGESSRARRFARGIKTLKDQIKCASRGGVINEADIPPPVALGGGSEKNEDIPPSGLNEIKNSQPGVVPMPTEEKSTIIDNKKSESQPEFDNEILNTLFERRNAYRQEALHAKKNGDNDAAIRFVRIVKQFDSVIAAVKSGQPVDLSEMPPMPRLDTAVLAPAVPTRIAPLPPPRARSKQESTHLKSTETDEGNESLSESHPMPPKAPPPPPPPAPTTVMEALEQRLQRYKEAEQSAKDEGNNSKARRLGRIVKQYQSAIAAHSKGKVVPFDELPTPPGFGPIPGQPAPPPLEIPDVDDFGKEAGPDPEPSTQPVNVKMVIPKEPVTPSAPSPNKPGSVGVAIATGGQLSTRQERQLDVLLKRQAVFKKAALEAKKNGDLAQAREHLRTAKGIDPLIEASHAGLPVDMSTLPLPPEEKASLQETDFDFVTAEDCIPGSTIEVYEKLEENLLNQIKMCINTRDHFRAIGDVGSGNRFEQLAVDSKKDLDAVRAASIAYKLEVAKAEDLGDGKKYETAPPRFHYESKTFSIVRCNTDLADNDIELTVIRGINYNIPNDTETYVRFDFPYPAEYPQKDKTQTSKDNNPLYEQAYLLAMQRSSRPCQRIFKRQAIKLEVWSKGGFFRGDSLIGTATVKLQPLETKCTLHDSFPLMDGRKAVGGKLEIMIRIRNPILGRQVEKVTEKWLVIDKL